MAGMTKESSPSVSDTNGNGVAKIVDKGGGYENVEGDLENSIDFDKSSNEISFSFVHPFKFTEPVTTDYILKLDMR